MPCPNLSCKIVRGQDQSLGNVCGQINFIHIVITPDYQVAALFLLLLVNCLFLRQPVKSCILDGLAIPAQFAHSLLTLSTLILKFWAMREILWNDELCTLALTSRTAALVCTLLPFLFLLKCPVCKSSYPLYHQNYVVASYEMPYMISDGKELFINSTCATAFL